MIDFGSSDSDFVEPISRRSSSKQEPTTEETASPLDLPPEYLVELARSGRSECKRCSSLIANKEIRIGIVVEGDWGLMTRWQHLKCTVFHKSITRADVLDGYDTLDTTTQDIVRERVKQSLNEVDEDDLPVDPGELIRKAWCNSMEPPDELVLPLLPYQKEGLSWMVNQEISSHHGGILADEMGMGKTVQTIATILVNRIEKTNVEQCKEWKMSDVKHDFKGSLIARGKTLIIVPTIALRQWKSEIARFTEENALSVLIYHGDGRETERKQLTKADIVLTTYKIMEIEYRKATAGTKIECSICKKKFYPEKLRIHRKYFCGEDAERTEAQARTVSYGRRRKRNSTSSSGTRNAASDGSSSESDSDIASQKKKIAKQTAKSSNIPKKTARAPAQAQAAPLAGSARVSKKRRTVKKEASEDSSEDDIARQKRLNKLKSSVGASKSKSTESKSTKSKNKRSAATEPIPESPCRKSSRIASITPLGKGPKYVDSDVESHDDCESSVCSSNYTSSSDESSVMSIDVKPIKRQINKSNIKKASSTSAEISKSEKDVEEEIKSALLKQALKNKNNVSKVSWLHNISWFRIVLDEAHVIKDRSTSTAHACFALVSLNKWCLTGTPLQNRVGELYSLVRFLRMDPHAYYYCRASTCSCKSLHYRFTQGRCDECGHTAMQHYCHFNRHILNPIKRAGYVSEGRRAMMKLKDQILDSILLRRTKVDRSNDILLPAKYISVRQELMDEREADFYEALYTQSKAQFDTYVMAGTVLNNYAHIFDILIRLRQAADHPYLVIYSNTIKDYESSSSSYDGRVLTSEEVSMKYSNHHGAADREETDMYCSLCHEPPEDPRKAKCGHIFCRLCILDLVEAFSAQTTDEVLDTGNRKRGSRALDCNGCMCPVCQKPLTISSIEEDNSSEVVTKFKSRNSSIMSKIDLKKFQSSTKLEALMQELHVMNRKDPGAKAIVFSQFVNMLELIAFRLLLGSLGCEKLLGYMSVESRDQALLRFNEDPDIKVLLVSLKTGGVALNLTVANYVYIMDPWWNPAAEMQAIDRVHRIGQNKPIFATRFIIKDSIEERILKLQEKKQLVFDGTVGGDASSMARLTVDDMRFLFH